jgi:pimeloyl-ACP methyl ester carboxylesterase
MNPAPYEPRTLPTGVRSRIIHVVNRLNVHVLEAGYELPRRPPVQLLHGFPDLAYGWRHLMVLLADSGYRVVAPNQRGFRRTMGWANTYDTPLEAFSIFNQVPDALALVSALGYRRTAMVVGLDLGSPVAAYCALARPDFFPSLVLMSAPFPGPPALAFDTAATGTVPVLPSTGYHNLKAALAALDPPRVIYQPYLSTRQANEDMSHPPQSLHASRSFGVRPDTRPNPEPIKERLP